MYTCTIIMKREYFFQPYFAKGINMDLDGVDPGPEVKVPIHTYHRLAIKQTSSDLDETKISYQINN